MVALLAVPPAAEAVVHALRWSPQEAVAQPRPATPKRPKGSKKKLEAYRGLGAWIDIYDRAKWRHPGRTVARLDRRGVGTIFLQTSNYGSRGPIKFPRPTARYLRAAHARGIHVVGWYVPDFIHFRRDLRRSVAAIRFQEPGGHRFDSFGLDIEANILPPGPRTRRLLRLSRAIRRAAGRAYPLGAITPSPRGMELSPTFWPGFPYGRLARHFDVFVPMAYWTYRAGGERGARRYISRSVELVRRGTGRPKVPIHMIGGLAGLAGPGEVRGFVKAVRNSRIIGASLYDADTTGRRGWAIIRRLAKDPSGSFRH
ncbi:MAG: hypothetical protein ACRDIX_10590 [Actinomycetota bacterium]